MTRLLVVSVLALSACAKPDAPPAPPPAATSSAALPAVGTDAGTAAPPSASAGVAAPTAASSSEISYVPYENDRFCFRIDTPRGMVAQPASANGDGQTWTSTDGTAEIRAWGSNIVVAEQSLDGLFAEESKDAPAKSRRVTMKTKETSWFVVSGYDGARIFYEKYIFAADHYVVFVAMYAPSGQAWWGGAVEHMVATFRAC